MKKKKENSGKLPTLNFILAVGTNTIVEVDYSLKFEPWWCVFVALIKVVQTVVGETLYFPSVL